MKKDAPCVRGFTLTELLVVIAIAAINVWNRTNAATRQVAGAWTSQAA